MKILYGTTRTVLCIGDFAIKFPRYSLLWTMCKNGIARVFGIKRRGGEMIYFVNGLVGNLTEYSSWLYSKSGILARVYFSVGFFSIQQRVCGEIPTWQELQDAFEQLPETARKQMAEVNQHHWHRESFRKTKEGIIMIDFGDFILDGELSLSSWLVRWETKLAKVLSF